MVSSLSWARADDHYFDDSLDVVDAWRHQVGVVPVCLSAPHAVTQIREGKEKLADLYTGGLAEAAALSSGASFTATVGKQTGDPNWDADHPYRHALLGLATDQAVVLDLHGMRDDRGVLINVGTGDGAGKGERGLAAALCRGGLRAGDRRGRNQLSLLSPEPHYHQLASSSGRYLPPDRDCPLSSGSWAESRNGADNDGLHRSSDQARGACAKRYGKHPLKADIRVVRDQAPGQHKRVNPIKPADLPRNQQEWALP